MTLLDLKTFVCDIGKKMVEYNYSAPMDGNISFKYKIAKRTDIRIFNTIRNNQNGFISSNNLNFIYKTLKM